MMRRLLSWVLCAAFAASPSFAAPADYDEGARKKEQLSRPEKPSAQPKKGSKPAVRRPGKPKKGNGNSRRRGPPPWEKRRKVRVMYAAGHAKTEVGEGGVVRTGPKSDGLVLLSPTVAARLKPNTALKVAKLEFDRKTGRLVARLQIETGKVLFHVDRKLKPGSTLVIATPLAAAVVRGTVFVVDARTRITRIEVLAGELDTYPAAALDPAGELAPRAAPVPVEAGQELDYAPDAAPGLPGPMTPAELKDERAWVEDPAEREEETELQETAEEPSEDEAPEEGASESPKP